MKVYHLNLDRSEIENARYALLPGDPSRVPRIAEKLDDAKEIAYNREFRTSLGEIQGTKILVTSTGIGGPSTSICVDELARLGVRLFLRVGTTGAIQPDINIGDVIITTGSVRLDGASRHFAPIEYPAIASYDVVNALVECARELQIRHHVGITASTDTFYQGQERHDSFNRYVLKSFQGSVEEWRKLKVLNLEMESSTLLTAVSTFGLKAGCISGVIDNRTRQENMKLKDVELAEQNIIRMGVSGMKKIIEKRLSK